jgi:hypothetical protein
VNTASITTGRRGPVRVEHAQAGEQQRHHRGEHGQGVTPPGHQRQRGHGGEDGIERGQLFHLVAGYRIDEQRGEGGHRQHHIKIRLAQQAPQRGAHIRGTHTRDPRAH